MSFNRLKFKKESKKEIEEGLKSWASRYDDVYDYNDYNNEWHYSDCECELCIVYTYDYINMDNFHWTHKIILTRYNRSRNFREPSLYGKYVDMESIYTKDELRDRRIDIILGNIVDNESKPKISDLYPNLNS